MNKQLTLHLNLASRPARNRRLFFILLILMGVLSLLIALAGGSIYFNFREKARSLRGAIAEIEGESERLQRESIRYTTQISNYSQTHTKKIDLINSMIYKKSFSWVGLFSTMEEILPASCFIVTLAHAYEEDKSIGISMRVAAPGLPVFQQLLQGLHDAGFIEIRLRSEAQASSGYYLYDLTFRYERII